MRNVHFKKNCWKSKHFRNLWLSPLYSLRVCLCLYANGLPRQRKLVKDETRWKISMRVVNWPQTVAHLRRLSSLHGSRKILILAWNSFSSWSSQILVFFNCEKSESVPPCHIIGQMQAWTFRVQFPTFKNVFRHSPWNSVHMACVHSAFIFFSRHTAKSYLFSLLNIWV